MGGLKNNWFFKTEVNFLPSWATWRVGVRKPKRYLWWAADSGYSQAACRFNDGVVWAFGFPRGCPPINSRLCLLFVFFLLRLLWEFLLLLPSVLSSAFSKWSPRTFLLVVFVFCNSNLSSSDFLSVRAFCVCFSFCCACCLLASFLSFLGKPLAIVWNVGFLGFFGFWICYVWLLHFLYVGFGSNLG